MLPGALWFDELGQLDVFQRVVSAKADFHAQVLVSVAAFVGINLAAALRGTTFLRSLPGATSVLLGSLVTGNLFASAADAHWPTYLLWRHRQPFGTVDPLSGRDAGFFVFSLPFYLEVCSLLLWLVAVSMAYAVLIGRVRGRLRLKPFHVDLPAQIHLAVLTSILLLVVSWRLRLERYLLVLHQPGQPGKSSGGDSSSFAGAGYVDVNVRSPTLAGLSTLALMLAVAVVLLPLAMRGRGARPVRIAAGITATVLGTVVALVVTLAPPVVQRYVVGPNPLLSEQPYLAASIAATRAGLGLDDIGVRPYEPAGAFTASDFPAARKRLVNVPAWDTYVLEARMRQLVTEPPYFSPQEPTLDVVTEAGRPQVTAVSARELDLNQVPGQADSWVNDRIAYTHGLGLVRFSSTDIGSNREPRLLDSGLGDQGLGVKEPRLYFGDLPPDDTQDGRRGTAPRAHAHPRCRRRPVPLGAGQHATARGRPAQHRSGPPRGVPLSGHRRHPALRLGAPCGVRARPGQQ